jgi:hypothetical protein
MILNIKIKQLGTNLLETLINFHKKENKVKFWLRRRNTNERLDNGFGSMELAIIKYKEIF